MKHLKAHLECCQFLLHVSTEAGHGFTVSTRSQEVLSLLATHGSKVPHCNTAAVQLNSNTSMQLLYNRQGARQLYVHFLAKGCRSVGLLDCNLFCIQLQTTLTSSKETFHIPEALHECSQGYIDISIYRYIKAN